jgi:hypothetical protein
LGALLGGGCGGHTLCIGLGLARGRATVLRGRVLDAGAGLVVCASGTAIGPLAQRLLVLSLFIVRTHIVCSAATATATATTLPRRHACRRA